MRAILALAILLLGLSSAAPEPKYPLLLAEFLQAADASPYPSLVEIESSVGRSDRLDVVALRTQDDATGKSTTDETFEEASLQPVSATEPATEPTTEPMADATGVAPATTPDVSVDGLCSALFESAEDNDLPVTFFANLLWQESRLRDDAVSPVGALGIAQFMPEVAVESGLDDPFDPLQAIRASARLLRALRDHFGNLGFVAAAYNAGARRVREWLEHRRSLPRETVSYVKEVTGRTVDQWRATPPGASAVKFVQRLPCRSLPAFASVEQAQAEQTRVEQAERERAQPPQPAAEESARKHHDNGRKHLGGRLHDKAPHNTGRNLHDHKREAARVQRTAHTRRIRA